MSVVRESRSKRERPEGSIIIDNFIKTSTIKTQSVGSRRQGG
jgi:hypothetical protein